MTPPTMTLTAPAITTADAPERKYQFRGPQERSMDTRNSLVRRDLRLRDSIREDAGSTMRDAAGGTKALARLMGVTERWVREQVSGRAPSVVSQFCELVLHVRDPWKLVVLVKVTAIRATMMSDSPAELCRKWWDDVGEGVRDAGAMVNRLANLRGGVDLRTLRREALDLAQSMETLAARCKELEKSRIDPTES